MANRQVWRLTLPYLNFEPFRNRKPPTTLTGAVVQGGGVCHVRVSIDGAS
jgi:hypothetical protein